MGCGVLCAMGLRRGDSSTSVAQPNCVNLYGIMSIVEVGVGVDWRAFGLGLGETGEFIVGESECWGSCSLLLGLHSSVSSLTLRPSSLALAIMADSGGMMSVIDVVLTLAVMGAAEMGLDGAGFTVGEGALWDNVGTWMGLVGGVGGLLDGSIVLELEDKVVGCDSGALGIVLLTNVAVVGLGGIGSSLGMVGALLDG